MEPISTMDAVTSAHPGTRAVARHSHKPKDAKRDAKKVLLCHTCAPTEITKLGPRGLRMAEWKARLHLFYQRNWSIRALMMTGPTWFLLAMTTAYFPETRQYSAMLIIPAILLFVLNEFAPLSSTPFNVYNSVTCEGGAYVAAGRVALVAIAGTVFAGMCLMIAEQVGTAVENATNRYKAQPPPTIWSSEEFPWYSTLLFVVPMAFFVSLVVSTSYTEKVTPRPDLDGGGNGGGWSSTTSSVGSEASITSNDDILK
jgi:hypothetical protein